MSGLVSTQNYSISTEIQHEANNVKLFAYATKTDSGIIPGRFSVDIGNLKDSLDINISDALSGKILGKINTSLSGQDFTSITRKLRTGRETFP